MESSAIARTASGFEARLRQTPASPAIPTAVSASPARRDQHRRVRASLHGMGVDGFRERRPPGSGPVRRGRRFVGYTPACSASQPCDRAWSARAEPTPASTAVPASPPESAGTSRRGRRRRLLTDNTGVVGFSTHGMGVDGFGHGVTGFRASATATALPRPHRRRPRPGVTNPGVVGSSRDQAGVTALSKNLVGVYAQSIAGTGTTIACGVFGDSTTKPGVVGASNVSGGVVGRSGAGIAGGDAVAAGVVGHSRARVVSSPRARTTPG